ncbi:MAG: hypothetical protein HQL66_04185 [Magnetococcales bacterium]|nr:hypothetical protein [Magnetococcales bacterium]
MSTGQSGVGEKAGGGGRPEAYDTSDGRYVGKGGGGGDASDYHRKLGYQIAARDPRNIEAAKRAREMDRGRAEQIPEEVKRQIRAGYALAKEPVPDLFKEDVPGGGGAENENPGARGLEADATDRKPKDGLTTPPIPEEVQKRKDLNPEDRGEFSRGVDRLSNPTQAEKDIYMRIYDWEGGMKENKDNGSVAGIMPQTLKELVGNGDLKPSDLRPEQVPDLYRKYFDNRLSEAGGHEALDVLVAKGGAETAKAVADVVFQHGGGAGRQIIQDALEKMGVPIDPSEKSGYIQEGTWKALLGVVGKGEQSQKKLRGLIGDGRYNKSPSGGVERYKAHGYTPKKR